MTKDLSRLSRIELAHLAARNAGIRGKEYGFYIKAETVFVQYVNKEDYPQINYSDMLHEAQVWWALHRHLFW